ncbi:MAG: lytic murein transglycosylase [Paracoccaceae bacterium]
MAAPTRRSVGFGLAALGLASCGTGLGVGGQGGRAALAASVDEPPEPRPDPGYHAWVAGYRKRALAAGIGAATFDAAFRGAGYLPQVIKNDRAQFEARRTLEDYIAIAASEERVRIGRAKLKAHGKLFDRIAARYGVAAPVVAAIWGSRPGSAPGAAISRSSRRCRRSATRSRRAGFFESQLTAALAILQDGDIAPGKMVGSWAGAMGHTQFIPTTYRAHAVDFTGDGRRDIWADDPADALASAANYLAKSGWHKGGLWGLEVRLPGASDDLVTRSVPDWRALRCDTRLGARCPTTAATLILPNGAGGPAFLLFANYRVLRTYNDLDEIRAGVGHLSDRLAGGGRWWAASAKMRRGSPSRSARSFRNG